MIEPLRPDNLREHLAAFIVGELTAEQTLAVLDHIAEHPSSIDVLRDQQRLRIAMERTLATATLPESLQRRLELLPITAAPPLNQENGNGASQHDGSRWGGRLPVLLSMAAVVGLCIGVWSMVLLRPLTSSTPPVVINPPQRQVVPLALVHAATGVHIDCSRVDEQLHAGGYPEALGPVANLVRQDVGTETPAPNLSSIGFHYVGAGPCANPLNGTAHLLYRKDGAVPRAAISVFAQKYNGQFELDAGRLYRVSSSEATVPMLVWRTKGVVYFLIADTESLADAALDAPAVAKMVPLRNVKGR